MKTSTLILLLVINICSAQDTSLLICGPMLCDVNHREATIWLEVTSAVKSVQIKWWKKGETTSASTISYNGILGNTYNPLKVVLPNMSMNTEFIYEIYL